MDAGSVRVEMEARVDRMIELQLLVIDLGDSCVVKVEKGVSGNHRSMLNGLMDLTYWHSKVVGISAHPFAEIRAALDALAVDGEKPVPRIEQSPAGSHSEYRLILADNSSLVWPERIIGLTWNDLQGLTTFIRGRSGVGTDLPVWTPKKGEWVELPVSGVTDGTYGEVPFAAWRFTLKNG